MKPLLFVSAAFLFILFTNVHSIAQQGVSINARGAAPDSNAILDVSSTTKGALFPRMTTSQRLAIDSPAIGLTVFDLDKRTYWYYGGSEWVEMTTNKDEWTNEDNSNSRANEDWNTQGNNIVAGAFLGTTNNQPLLIKTNGTERMRVTGTGNVGIDYINPLNRTDIHLGVTRTGSHATGRPLYVTGDLGQDANGIEFRDNNATQGIGFGYNTIYATGTSLNQDLGLKARGSGGSLKFTTDNVERMRIRGNGNVGIGTSIPNAPLQFANDDRNRKIVMWEYANNDNEFTGFGVNAFILRYQVPWTNANHVFYAGNGPSSSNELMRIQGNGNVGIDVTNPLNRTDIHLGVARFGTHATGRPLYVTGDLGQDANGIEFRHNNATQGIGFGYNTIYATGTSLNQDLGLKARGSGGSLKFITNNIERIRIQGNGNVGIGNTDPHAPLQFASDERNRKIVLWQNSDDDHQFAGFGINNSILRYQVVNEFVDHVFYAGTSDTTSKELMRIKGNGNVEIPGSLDIGYVRAFGASVDVSPLSSGSASCDCPSGLVAIGGGFNASSKFIVIKDSYANTDSSWHIEAYNSSLDPHFIQAFIICARLAN